MRTLLVGCALAATASAAVPAFPLQFVATVETTAHLVDKSKPYPPWKKRIRLAYDYLNKRARADIMEGLDAGKNFTRRYDTKQDYVTTGGTFPSCQRSYLGERMPMPQIPEGAVKQSSGALIDDEPHDEYRVEVPELDRVRVWVSAATGRYRRLTNENWVDGRWVALMTYDLLDFEEVAPAEDAVALDAPWTHETCDRHVGGWPYLHLFHHYLAV